MKNVKEVSIFWFRRDLRLHDNHGLYQALKNSQKVLPIFIFDKNILNKLPDRKDRRVHFIYKNLVSLNLELQTEGSSLLVLHDEPLNAFKTICDSYTIKNVYTNHDYEPYAIARDKEIEEWLRTKHIPFHSFKDQVIFEKGEVMKADGSPYTIFTPYSKVWKQKLDSNAIQTFQSNELFSNFYILSQFG